MISFRKLFPLAIVGATWLYAGAAWASGDFTCATEWKLNQRQYADCDNLPFLSPGNDTRVNLQLLLMDAGQAKLTTPPATTPPTPPIAPSAAPFTWEGFLDLTGPNAVRTLSADEASGNYEEGEGSRCRSDKDGAAAFKAALDASPSVPAAERTALESARDALAPSCNDAQTPAAYAPPAGVNSALGRQFSLYLVGTADFYDGDFDGARKAFTALQSSSQPWLKETARYMLGRAAVNNAQVAAFDDFGVLSPDKVDADALKEAETDFNAYLHDYPSGRYAASTRGLLRRVDWLGGKTQKLAADYDAAFAHSGPSQRNVSVGDLMLEADNKLLTKVKPEDVKAPMLLATLDLMAMRTADPYADAPPPVIKLDVVTAQKPLFASAPDLFEYLLAAHLFYIEHDPAGALGHLGAGAPTGAMNELVFSRLVLRGLALEAQKNWAGARQLWMQMLPLAKPAFQRPMLDLALAMNEERDGRLAQIFAAGTTIHDPQVREILLRNDAGPALLVERIKAADGAARERRVARYVLLYKDVMRARYAAFASDEALVAPGKPPTPDSNDPAGPEPDPSLFDWAGTKADYPCESLRKLAPALAASPRQSHNLLCMGEFARTNALDANALNASAAADELGGAPTQFPGQTFARLEAYKQVMADTAAPAGDRAYALYRAINCYAPASQNECDGKDVPKAERARWFHTLKTDYASSAWARDLKYYW